MTSDKFIYLFGKTMPSLSLIISMTFRFVPRFASQLKVVSDAQKCLGRDMRSGGVIMRARSGLNILSIMMTWSLENAIETADSMKSRGYGNSGRTTFSMYKFDKRDKKALIIVVLLGIYIFIGSLMGKMSFTYFPVIRFAKVSLSSISVFVAYLLLCIYPVIIEIREVIRWTALKLKI
jgi:energy-coupling factor transport system permease protein